MAVVKPYISLLDREKILEEVREILRPLVKGSGYTMMTYVPLRSSYGHIALASKVPVERSPYVTEPGDDPSVILEFLKLPLADMAKHINDPGNTGIIAKLRLEKGV